MLRNLLLRQVAQTACAAGGIPERAEWQAREQLAGELDLQIVVPRTLQKHLLGLAHDAGNEVLHLLAVLALSRGDDQGVQTIDEGAVAPVGLGVSGLIT